MAFTTCCIALLLLCLSLSSVFAQSSCPIAYGCQCGNNLLQNRPGTAVICARGNLTMIPVMEMPRETRYLIIQAPSINPNRFRLQLGMFSKFDQLQELHLTGSEDLRSVGEDVFLDLSRTLRVLNLTNNAIQNLTENNFRNLANLTQLYLDNNYITSSPSSTFIMLKQLQLLSLRNNYIRELPFEFRGLSQLNTLDLSDNPLGTSQYLQGTVPASAFNHAQQLRVLLLHNTSMEVLPYSTLARLLPKLEQLDIGASRFCSIEEGQFNRFRSLKQLDLDGMKCPNTPFKILPRGLQGMSELQRVDLGGNNLSNLDGVLNGVSRLESLNLAGNDLQQLQREDFIDVAGSLVSLDLSQNERLALRPGMFSIFPQLLQLDLSRMGLNDGNMPNDLFSYQNRIQWLNLSRNGLSKLDSQILHDLPNLEVLDLSHNRLERVPEGLGGDGPGTQQPHNTINVLYLNDNRLREFPQVQLSALRSSATPILTLHNNPWLCNCDILDMYNWIVTREGQDAVCGTPNGTSPGCPTCEEPLSERNTLISALNPNFFARCRSPVAPLKKSHDDSSFKRKPISGRSRRYSPPMNNTRSVRRFTATILVQPTTTQRIQPYYQNEQPHDKFVEHLVSSHQHGQRMLFATFALTLLFFAAIFVGFLVLIYFITRKNVSTAADSGSSGTNNNAEASPKHDEDDNIIQNQIPGQILDNINDEPLIQLFYGSNTYASIHYNVGEPPTVLNSTPLPPPLPPWPAQDSPRAETCFANSVYEA